MKPYFRVALTLGFLFLSALLVVAAGQLAWAAVQLVPPNVQWGPDIRVNLVSGDLTKKQTNIALAINPTDRRKALSSYDFDGNNGAGSGYSLSTDAGRTWAGTLLTGTWSALGMAPGMAPDGNTGVDFDGHGTAFLTSHASSATNYGYFVLTSTNGTAWSTPVPVVATDLNSTQDQARLAVDRRLTGPNAGSAYMVWRYVTASHQGIWVSYSRDGGSTWSPQAVVSDPSHTESSGPMVAVASDGTVYAAFVHTDATQITGTHSLFLDRSTDGGATWGTDRMIAGAPVTIVGAPDKKGRELILVGDAAQDKFPIDGFPSIAVSRSDPNTVYAVWHDGRWDSTFVYFGNEGRHGDIAFSRSTDGGLTWTAPMRVNDDAMANGVDQFQPTVAVGKSASGSEIVGVTWYDRRSSNGYLYDLYYSESTDGGLTWSTNRRVSNYSSDPMAVVNGKGVGDLGFYSALVYAPAANNSYSDYVLPSWVDSRRGRVQDVYTDRGLTCPVTFGDVLPTDYFYEPVSYLFCSGAISGYSDNTFRPYNNTTRGQLTKIIAVAEGWPIYTPPTPTFRDVPATAPFYSYIETAYNRGVISGYTCGTGCLEFRTGNLVTRGQIAKIVVAAQGWPIYTPPAPTFRDVPTGDPFYQFIETAYNRGVISGYTCGTGCLEFRTGNNATRGQVSKIIYNTITAP